MEISFLPTIKSKILIIGMNTSPRVESKENWTILFRNENKVVKTTLWARTSAGIKISLALA